MHEKVNVTLTKNEGSTMLRATTRVKELFMFSDEVFRKIVK